ncbi:M16 family metallopeptidase [Salinarimonas ramus]|uniref:Peptidase M16 C-terminal domain-containing protein n=1 Tax=Salinarimonas ramus TaxID=690164 RepID=A0A917V5Z5_9HYPH|nr:insulinase family protein [Salinarimonas ramus]GGK41625.1 hypothetical protein GCM10011322_30960 [Salinarimonas ramus]
MTMPPRTHPRTTLPRPSALLGALALALAALIGTTAAQASDPVARTTPGGVPYLHVALPDAAYGTIVLTWPNTHALERPGREGLLSLAPPLMGERIAGEPMRTLGEALQDERQGFVLTNSLFETRLALVSERTGDDAFSRVSEVAADMLVRADLAPEDLARLQRNVLDNLAAGERNPAFMAERALGALVGAGDPRLAALSNRPPRTVEAVTREDVAAWRDAVFDRRPIAVAAGPQPLAAMEAAIDAVLAPLPDESAASPEPKPADWRNLGETVVVEAPEATQAIVLAAIATPAHHLYDRMLVGALAGGPGSILFEALRTRLGAAYDVGLRVYPITPDQALVGFGAPVPPERAAEVVAAMRETFASLAEEISPDVFARATAREAQALAQAAGDPNAQVQAILARRAEGLDGGVAAMAEALEGLNVEAFAAYLAEVFATPATVAVVTPEPGAFGEACIVTVPEEAAVC